MRFDELKAGMLVDLEGRRRFDFLDEARIEAVKLASERPHDELPHHPRCECHDCRNAAAAAER